MPEEIPTPEMTLDQLREKIRAIAAEEERLDSEGKSTAGYFLGIKIDPDKISERDLELLRKIEAATVTQADLDQYKSMVSPEVAEDSENVVRTGILPRTMEARMYGYLVNKAATLLKRRRA